MLKSTPQRIGKTYRVQSYKEESPPPPDATRDAGKHPSYGGDRARAKGRKGRNKEMKLEQEGIIKELRKLSPTFNNNSLRRKVKPPSPKKHSKPPAELEKGRGTKKIVL